MKRGLVTLIVLLAVTLAGGAITSQVFRADVSIIQTTNPNASVFDATPEQAAQIIIWIAFVLFNLVGAGVTLALLFWFGSRAVARARAMPERETTNDDQLPERASAES